MSKSSEKHVRNDSLVASRYAFAEVLQRDYGRPFLAQLATQYFGNNGVILTCISLGQMPYYKARGVTGIKYQLLKTVSVTPWGAKGLFGVLSDTWPIGGYHKRYWMFLGALLGSIGLTCLGFFPNLSLEFSAICFFGAQCAIVIGDLLCQGKYAEMMASGSDGSIVSYAFYCREGGRLLTACIVGPLADGFEARYILLVALPWALLALLPPLLGCMPEARNITCGCQTQGIAEHPGPFALAVVQSFSALGMGALLVVSDDKISQCICAVCISLVLILFSYKVLPRIIANCNLYMFCCTAMYLGLDTLDYWYTASKECIPDGPGFSMTYYFTFANIIQAACGIAAVVLFDKYIKNWRVRPAFWVTTLVKIVASLSDIVLVKRWNKQINLPDTWAFIIGHAAIDQLAEMLDFLPLIFLVGKLCPKNMESTIFAILIGFSNFGKSLASIAGAILLTALGVQIKDPKDGPKECDVGGLPASLLLGHMLLPMLTIPLTFVLLPDKKLDDDFLDDIKDSGNDLEMTSPKETDLGREAAARTVCDSQIIGGNGSVRPPDAKTTENSYRRRSSQTILCAENVTESHGLLRRSSNALGQPVPLSSVSLMG